MKTPRGAVEKSSAAGQPCKIGEGNRCNSSNRCGFAISRRGSPEGVRAAPDFASLAVVPANAGTHTPRLLLLEKTGNADLIEQFRPVVMGPCARAQLRTRQGRRKFSDFNFKEPTHLRDLAARFRPRFALELPAHKSRGRREDRVLAAPAVSCAIVRTENAHEHTGSAETLRPSLRSGLTAYFELSPVNGSFATVAAQGVNPRNLMPAPRHQDHTTSPYASCAYVSRIPRPPHLTARS